MPLPFVTLSSFDDYFSKLSGDQQDDASQLMEHIRLNDGQCPPGMTTAIKHFKAGHERVAVTICKPKGYRLSYCTYNDKLVFIHINTRDDYYKSQKRVIAKLGKGLKRIG